MDYKIDYFDASSRQEIVSVYSLYFYIVESCEYNFDVGHLIISLLTYMVEEGRLNFYAMKVFEIKSFVNEYMKGIDFQRDYNLDEIVENFTSKLQGARLNGEPITFKYYDFDLLNIRSIKIAYIDYSLKDEGFKITDKGLEFLISTKEIPQESKLTVALYMFKLQLEKKKYKAALNTIKNINLETLRQLDIKNEILSMNRYSREEASKLYKKYWGDYFDIRSEETSHYAKERLKLYKESEYLEKNNIKLTPDDIDVLKAIDIELSKSSNLQAIYTNEISKMPFAMLEIDKSLMVSIFLSLFNLKEHFSELTKLDTSMYAFLNSLQPLFLPKKNKSFGISMALSGQKVNKQLENVKIETINIKTQKHEDWGNTYEERMKNNYFKFFEMLIIYLTKIKSEIYEINDFINYVEKEKGTITLQSIDFLSFLLSLSYLPDVHNENIYQLDNTQIIKLDEKNIILRNSVEIFQVQELLTYFWFEKLKMKYNAEIHITTEPKNKVFLNGQNNRSICNIKIRIIEKGSRKDV